MVLDGYEDVFAGLSVADGIAAIVAAGTVVAVVEFSGWCVNKVAGFFDGDDELDVPDDEMLEGQWICDFCGDVRDEEAYCMEYGADLMCGLCSRDDSRFAD